MKKREVKIKENHCLKGDFHRLVLALTEEIKAAKPGQFCSLSFGEEAISLPLSIHFIDEEKEELDFYYEAKEGVAKDLRALKEGDSLFVEGPKGEAFDLVEGKKVAVIGEGMGLAPVKYLLEALKHKNEVTFIIGAKNVEALEILDHFSFVRLRGYMCTEDGSFGMKGSVSEKLKDLMESLDFDKIYACVNEESKEAVEALAKEKKIPYEFLSEIKEAGK